MSMSRTTINIESPLLSTIPEMARKERKTLGKLISELLAAGLEVKKKNLGKPGRRLKWHTQRMGARIDYTDKDQLYSVLDESK